MALARSVVASLLAPTVLGACLPDFGLEPSCPDTGCSSTTSTTAECTEGETSCAGNTFVSCNAGRREELDCGAAARCVGSGGCAPCTCADNVATCPADPVPETTVCGGATPVCSAGACVGVKALAQGIGQTMCAVTDDERLRCWGSNDHGEVGVGAACQLAGNAKGAGCLFARPTEVAGLTGVREASVGFHHTCARLSDGGVRCWGDNSMGQLGQGNLDLEGSKTPLPVALPGGRGAIALRAGPNNVCVVLDNYTAACWGDNGNEQMGPAGPVVVAPVGVGLKDVLEVAIGSYVMCARLSDTTKCFGSNADGELGIGNMDVAQTEGEPIFAEAVDAIAVSEQQACARQIAGELKCWGLNYWGCAIGNGATNGQDPKTKVATPTPVVGLLGAQTVQVSTGWRNTCGVLVDGSVWCWGSDDYGHIGDGKPPTPSKKATRVEALGPAIEVTTHFRNSCVLEATGRVACWGDNEWGAVGDGTADGSPFTYDASTPVTVAW